MAMKQSFASALLFGHPRKLWRRYVLAMILVASLITGSHLMQRQVLELAVQDAEIINMAGRQRMLSQRILFLALDYNQTGSSQSREQLVIAIDLFESSHNWLISLRQNTDAVVAHYIGAGGLDQASRIYIDATRSILASNGSTPQERLDTLVTLGRDQLLSKLDQAVTLFERDASAHAMSVSRTADIALYLALAVIVIEGALIFVPAQLSVNRALTRLEDRNALISDQKHELEVFAAELEYAATHDGLTGLANRGKFFAALTEALNREGSPETSLLLMQIDLDLFKQVNDTFGHPAGDVVLVRSAQRMTEVLPKDAVIARLGGDEFTIFLDVPTATAQSDATQYAQDLITKLSEPVEYDGDVLQVGASVGMAFQNEEISLPDDLVAFADQALYGAKRKQRGTARLYTGTEDGAVGHVVSSHRTQRRSA